jgi:hypothetical protein
LRPADLIELVDEDDALVLHQLHRFFGDHLPVDQGFGLLLQKQATGFADCDLALLLLLGHDPLEHALQIHVHLFHAHVGEDLHRHDLLFDA